MSEQPLVLVATFRGTPQTGYELARRLREMVGLTRSEIGCVRYDLHLDRDDENTFVFIETWATKADWDEHMTTPHVKALLRDAPSLTRSGAELLHLTPV